MTSHILTVDTDDDCWLSYTNPVNNVVYERQSRVKVEFNGSAHIKKLQFFLATVKVVPKPGKLSCAVQLRKYIRQLKRTVGEFQAGGNITVTYKELKVDFSI